MAEEKSIERTLPEAPVAKKVAHEMSIHGDTRVDDYFWMRLSDEQKNAAQPDQQTEDVLAYLEAENEYKDSVLKDTEALQEKLYEEKVTEI